MDSVFSFFLPIFLVCQLSPQEKEKKRKKDRTIAHKLVVVMIFRLFLRENGVFITDTRTFCFFLRSRKACETHVDFCSILASTTVWQHFGGSSKLINRTRTGGPAPAAAVQGVLFEGHINYVSSMKAAVPGRDK